MPNLFCVLACLQCVRCLTVITFAVQLIIFLCLLFSFLLLFFSFFFFFFFVIFASSLPLHTSICQQTIPCWFRPVSFLYCGFSFFFLLLFIIFILFHLIWFYLILDSVLFCFVFLEGLEFRLSSSLRRFPRGSFRLFDHVMKMDWQERVIAMPRLHLRQRSSGENGRLENQAFLEQLRHW